MIFAADLSAAQRRSILGHKTFRDSDWSANNPQPSSEPIGESCTLLGHMLLPLYTGQLYSKYKARFLGSSVTVIYRVTRTCIYRAVIYRFDCSCGLFSMGLVAHH